MYSAFCYQYQRFAARHKATLHVEHKPGERLEVDWAGDTASLTDNTSGKPIPVYVFVAVLPCSGYSYAEGFLSQNLESWITAHVNAYQFFGGATRILTPDNLKTGVEKAHPVLTGHKQDLSRNGRTLRNRGYPHRSKKTKGKGQRGTCGGDIVYMDYRRLEEPAVFLPGGVKRGDAA
jgi:hypothetical protein